MSWTISRKYNFSAAHRLEGHPKCGRLHGHNYEVEVLVSVMKLPVEGWIMDYAQLDALVKPVIEELDHRYIVSDENAAMLCPYVPIAYERGDAARVPIERSTAELLSEWLRGEVYSALKLMDLTDASVTVQVRESEKSGATYRA